MEDKEYDEVVFYDALEDSFHVYAEDKRSRSAWHPDYVSAEHIDIIVKNACKHFLGCDENRLIFLGEL